MEKRISFFEYQNAVSVAKLIDPFVKQLQEAKTEEAKLKENYDKLVNKLQGNQDKIASLQGEIDKYESGIVKVLGFHVSDLIKKVVVPTGKMTPAGKPATTTDYVPANNVKFDDATKEYVISIETAQGAPVEAPVTTSPLNN